MLELSEVELIARWATDDVRPDLTVLLDSDPEQAVAKLAQQDRLEAAGAEFHARVRRGFVELARRDPEHYLVVPARQRRETIAEQVLARVQERLALTVRDERV